MSFFAACISKLVSPLSLAMMSIGGGYFIGKIRIGKIKLQLAGVLTSAVIIGLVVALFPSVHIGETSIMILNDSLLEHMRCFSSLGMTAFVAAIGVQSGYEFRESFTKRHWLYIVVGGLVVLLSALLTYIIGRVDETLDRFLLIGVFCGAMTSTPGLSAVSEMTFSNEAALTIGYGNAYLFGVLGTIMTVRLLQPHDIQSDVNNIPIKTCSLSIFKCAAFLGFVILLGQIIGQVSFFDNAFVLGSTGGILVSGILCGFVVLLTKNDNDILSENLAFFRDIGLILFFVGKGIPAGFSMLQYTNLRTFGYAMVITAFSIGVALMGGYFLTHGKRRTSLYCLCGAMTSTPALGVLMENDSQKSDLSIYTMVYFGALFANVFCSRVLVYLMV